MGAAHRHDEKHERKLEIAGGAIRRWLAKGEKLGGIKGVKNILKLEAQDMKWPEDYFDDLSIEDLADLVSNAAEGAYQQPVPGAQARDETSVEGQSSGDGGKTGESRSGNAQGRLALTYEQPIHNFKVRIHSANSTNIDLIIARRCEEPDSYIARNIIVRNKLAGQVEQDGAIRLTWIEVINIQNFEKTKSTRFKVVEEGELETDIVLGKKCCEDEGELEMPAREVEGLTLRREGGSHSSSYSDSTTLVTYGSDSLPTAIADPAEFAAKFWVKCQEELSHQSLKRTRQVCEEQTDLEPASKRMWPRYGAG